MPSPFDVTRPNVLEAFNIFAGYVFPVSTRSRPMLAGAHIR